MGETDGRSLQLWATLELENLVTDRLRNVRPALRNDYVASPPQDWYRPERSAAASKGATSTKL